MMQLCIQYVLRIETKVEPLQRKHSSHHQSRSYKQHQGKCRLCNDQTCAKLSVFEVTAHTLPASGHARVEIAMCSMECWRQTAEQRSQEGTGQRKPERFRAEGYHCLKRNAACGN